MGHLIDENKFHLQEEQRKLKKFKKSLKIIKFYKILIFKSTRNKLTASGDIIHSNLNDKLMGPVSMGLPKEKTIGKNIKLE